MEYRTISYSLDDGVLLLELAREEKLNAFTVEMADELENAYDRASVDDAVKVIVVTGGGKAFCAGMDLSVEGNVFGLDESLRPTMADMRDRFDAPDIQRGVRDTGGRVSLAMFRCLKPIVGAINGVAVGIGATMTLPMDFRLASENTKMGFVFGRLGIVPEACSTWFLPRLVGQTKALEWLYSARIFGAQEALEAGLLSAIHPPERLREEAISFARSLVTDRSPASVALIRQMILRNATERHPLEAHRVESLAMFYTSIGDGKEGVAAFLEKRKPVFAAGASSARDVCPWD